MNQTIYIGLMASFLTGMATAIGALPILFTSKLEEKWQSILLGIGGGVMLAVRTFSLIMPGKEAAIALGYSQKSSALIISIGITLGAALLWLIHNKFSKGYQWE